MWFDTPRGLVRAVDGVSLDLQRGQTLGVVGESGSGKSVLSRAIMKILAPNARVLPGSTILLDGVDLATVNPKKQKHLWGVDLAMVFQDPMTSLTPVLQIGKQLTETIEYHTDLDGKAAKEEAIRLLQLVGIPEPAETLPSSTRTTCRAGCANGSASRWRSPASPSCSSPTSPPPPWT